MLKPQKLSLGDTIGIIAPCIALTKEEIAVAKKNMVSFYIACKHDTTSCRFK